MIIPAKYRSKLAEGKENPEVMAVLGPEECLELYPLEEYLRMCVGQDQLPQGSPDNRQHQRVFYSHAQELELDKQGRVLIPLWMRSLVKIDRDIVIAGVRNRLEIWSKDAWEVTQAVAFKSRVSLAERFMDARPRDEGNGGRPGNRPPLG